MQKRSVYHPSEVYYTETRWGALTLWQTADLLARLDVGAIIPSELLVLRPRQDDVATRPDEAAQHSPVPDR